MVTVTDAANNPTGYAYDNESSLLSITDALGRATVYSYDGLRRVTKTTFPSQKFESYGYDPVGNLLSKTDRNMNTTLFTYDGLNRLVTKQYPDNTTVNYTYDAANRLTQVIDVTGTYAFTYDPFNRLTNTTTNYSFLVSTNFNVAYGYDAASNRTTMTYPAGNGSVTYGYDSLNRFATLADSISGNFNFGYDALGRRTSLTRPNGVTTVYNFDTVSNLTTLQHQLGGTTIDSVDYGAPDPVGNRLSKTSQLRGATSEVFGYDSIYQLKTLTRNGKPTLNYSYDGVGNRLTGGAVYNVSNQLTNTATATYTYDANGNLLTKTEFGRVTTYTWDFENRLMSVTQPRRATANFKYDPFGWRIQKAFAGNVSNYLYDGTNLTEEVDQNGSVMARYTYGRGIDEPLALRKAGANYFYEADGLGSVTSITDANGTLLDSYRYDAFGSALATLSQVSQPFRFTGREFDPETGLYYYRARYYDQTNGRFMSEDPLGFGGSESNAYAYVNSNPINRVDPLGWASCIFYVREGRLWCTSWRPYIPDLDIRVSSGNNGGKSKCKNNSDCQNRPNRGPIPEGWWVWTNEPTQKPNGRVLQPLRATDTFGRGLFRTHSCANAFGPSVKGPFCSEGCVTGSADDIRRLNEMLDAEPGSILYVTPKLPILAN